MEIIRTITDAVKWAMVLATIITVAQIIFIRQPHTDPIGDIISQSIITKNQDRHR